MKKIFTAAVFATLILSVTKAQNTFPSTGAAGIGTTTPNASSLLEIKSTTKGLLIPRMTKTQRDAIVTPATGLMIYQTNSTPGFYYYSGTAWTAVSPKANGWSLTGNAGTDSSINFIGTTDAHPLVFRVNNIKAGYIDYNVAKGNTSFGYLGLASNTTGVDNTAHGMYALYLNTIGFQNSATGFAAMYSNINGNYNSAHGAGALNSNTSGFWNNANGAYAMYFNNTGSYNTANGGDALYSNTVGWYNTANGYEALHVNTEGEDNSAYGAFTLGNNTTGINNTAAGVHALANNTIGSFNTALGSSADVAAGNFTNATAIGCNAYVNASRKVRIGDVNVTVVESQVGSWTTSDGRFKNNIKENVKGLEFIKLLRPVTYNFDTKKFSEFLMQNYPDSIKQKRLAAMDKDATAKASSIVQSGFVAQEVQEAVKKSDYNFNGVHAPENPTDNWSLSYEKLTVPLVKAVQELSNQNDSLKSEIGNLKSEMAELKAMIVSSQSSINDQQSIVVSSASIQQNIPNPFTHSTTIGYSLPSKFSDAQIVITDKNGKTIKAVNVSGSGKGSLNVDASVLASGAYQYSLIVDGKLIATKQMVIAK